MRLWGIAVLAALAGCSGSKSTSPDGTTEPDPKGWTITIDTTGLDRFVQPADAATWPIAGRATASEGLDSVAIAGALVDVDANGAFAGSVPVAPGLTPVPILATDTAGHTRKGDRTLLAARFLADGAYNPQAARLVLTDAVLSAMSDGVASYAADVDVAGEILARDVLSQDDRCVTWPVSGHQGAVAASLVADGGDLWLRIRVPGLYIYFEGQCQGLLSTIPIAGEMAGTLDIWTQLAAMSDGVASYAADVDVAGEILARDVLSQDDRCVTWPVSGHQGAVTASLVADGGDLWLRIRVPGLYIYFEGQCQGLLSTIPIAGEMAGTLDIWTQLAAKPPANGGCLRAFDHSAPEVSVSGWGFDVWGTSGPLQSWIVDLFSGNKSAEARAQLVSEVGTRADDLLATKLADVTVFERSSQLELLGRPLALELCVSDLDGTGNTLSAQIAARATGAGTREAPGTPQLDGAIVRAASGELVLDANVIGQLLFAAWRDNALVRGAPDIDIGVLQILMPGLAEEFPDATAAQVAIDAELPPYVRATPDGPGDLQVELGDLMIDVTVAGTRVLRFGTVLTLALELVPQDGALVPTVVDTQAHVVLLDERYDGSDDALEQAVQLQIGTAASALLADGAAIALPDLPGLGAPVDVTADPGGRYLHLSLAP
jgi:hypothetical protein